MGKLITEAGGETRTIHDRITDKTLRGVNVLIIVDPDTPQKSDQPRYIASDEVNAIDQWVRGGGRLMLMGSDDKGNAEFEHFNQLARRFGITFREETYPKVAGKDILRTHGEGSIFAGGSTVYLVEIAPLDVRDPKNIQLADNGIPVMALAPAGKRRGIRNR